MKQNSKPSHGHVYHVHFADPIAGALDYYFSSLAAIYTVFTPEQIGCKVTRLWNLKVADGETYENKICRISRQRLHRKPQTNEA